MMLQMSEQEMNEVRFRLINDAEFRAFVHFLMKCSNMEVFWIRQELVGYGMASKRCAAKVCEREFKNLNV